MPVGHYGYGAMSLPRRQGGVTVLSIGIHVIKCAKQSAQRLAFTNGATSFATNDKRDPAEQVIYIDSANNYRSPKSKTPLACLIYAWHMVSVALHGCRIQVHVVQRLPETADAELQVLSVAVRVGYAICVGDGGHPFNLRT